jgi:hypothetical protein
MSTVPSFGATAAGASAAGAAALAVIAVAGGVAGATGACACGVCAFPAVSCAFVKAEEASRSAPIKIAVLARIAILLAHLKKTAPDG